MAVSIGQLRLTFLWAVSVPGLFESPAGGPAYWVSSAAEYQKAFKLLQLDPANHYRGVTLPWRPTARQRFWSYYSEALQAQLLTANRAWKLLMPFRLSQPLDLVPPSGTTCVQEAFLFPHAIGFGLTLTVETNTSLDGAVEQAIALYREKLFTLKDASGAHAVTARSAGEQAIRGLLGELAGPNADATLKPLEPFVLVSITRASGNDLRKTVKEGGAVHRALEGFCTLSATWKNNSLQPLATACLQRGVTRPKEHLLYATSHGRAVWHPTYLDSTDDNRAPLNCYHRNLSFASVQTQSLLELIELVQDERTAGRDPTGFLNDCLQRASGILGRLHGGSDATYRSHTVQRQIADSGHVDAISHERQRIGMAPLK